MGFGPRRGGLFDTAAKDSAAWPELLLPTDKSENDAMSVLVFLLTTAVHMYMSFLSLTFKVEW